MKLRALQTEFIRDGFTHRLVVRQNNVLRYSHDQKTALLTISTGLKRSECLTDGDNKTLCYKAYTKVHQENRRLKTFTVHFRSNQTAAETDNRMARNLIESEGAAS